MDRCTACQAQLLEYLYDLLDEAERQDLVAHLESCPACQAALAQAQKQQDLLAAAARMEFRAVRFEPPVEEPVTLVPVLLLQSRPRRSPALARWAAAAAVLLAVAGVAVPTMWARHTAATARRTIDEHEARVAQLQQTVRALDEQATAAHEECDRKLERLAEEEKRQYVVQVSGPRAVQPGGGDEFKIETLNAAGRPVPAKIRAELRDANRGAGGVVPLVRDADSTGVLRARVPAGLPLDPAARYQLVVHAWAEGLEAHTAPQELSAARPVYETYLTTDRPSYRSGEIVHFRSLTLDRRTLQPAHEELRLVFFLVSPRGRVIPVRAGASNLVRPREDGTGAERLLGPDGQPLRGIGAGSYLLPEGLEPGEYRLTVREELGRFAETSRRLLVQRATPPRVHAELAFDKSSYRPGEQVTAVCQAMTAAGKPLANQTVALFVTVDGNDYDIAGRSVAISFQERTDATGTARIRFRLPPQIEQGAALLHAAFTEVGPAEKISWTIPVMLDRLDVAFFPEGGELVTGLPCRVYFQALTPLGRPAEIEGRLLEDGKPLGVIVRTAGDPEEPGADRGLGRFTFTPKAGRRYEVEVRAHPGGRFPLPAVQADGVALTVPAAVIEPGKPIAFEVRSQRPRALVAALYCRGRLLDTVRLAPGQTVGRFAPSNPAGGVCRITVLEDRFALNHPLPLAALGAGLWGLGAGVAGQSAWLAAADLLAGASGQEEQVPLAERLVYRRPAERLNLDIQADRFAYNPGQTATITLRSSDENGWATPAVVQVAVVDRNALARSNDHTGRSLPTHFLLAGELRHPAELEYADFLLGPQPAAAEALDLVLGTLGWRRFTRPGPGAPSDADADRLVLAQGRSDAGRPSFAGLAREARARCATTLAQLHERRVETVAELEREQADQAYTASVATVDRARGFLGEARLVVPPVAAAVLVVLVAVALIQATRQALADGAPWLVAAAGCAALLWLGLTLSLPAPVERTGDTVAFNTRPWQVPEQPRFGTPEVGTTLELKGRDVAEHQDQKKGDGPDRGVPWAGGFGAGAAKPTAPGAAFPIRDDRVKHPDVRRGEDASRKADDRALEKQSALAVAKRPVDLKKTKMGEGKEGLNLDKDKAPPASPEKEAVDETAALALRQRLMEEQKELQRNQFTDGKGKAAPGPNLGALPVREFAHQRGAARKAWLPDLTETLYWNPVLVLPGEGEAVFSFPLSDLSTSFEVTAFGHTLDGRLGAATHLLESRAPTPPAKNRE